MGMYILIAVVVIVLGWLIFKPKAEKTATTETPTGSKASAPAPSNDALIAATVAAIAAQEDEIAAVITAALAFHGISGGDRIIAVRPIENKNWKLDAKISAVHGRDAMF